MLVGLIIIFPWIPDSTRFYLAVAVSAVLSALVVWAYLGERISKKVRVPRPLLQLTRSLPIVSFITACFIMPVSLYILYQAGYLQGSYDILAPLNEILNRPIPADWLPTIHRAVVVSLIGVAVSTISIASSMYVLGIIRGRGRKVNKTHTLLGVREPI